MTSNNLAQRLQEIYAEYGMDPSGRYEGREFCTEPCCYPRVSEDQAGCDAIEALMEEALPGQGWRFSYYPADYSGIKDIVKYYERLVCEHAMAAQGPSSATSTGMMIVWKCVKCDFWEYRKP